eukprot:COSAG05_NODE_141_length_16655_cov_22.580963_2_plen_248_part_00
MEGEVALIVGGGAGVSASCARLFAVKGMKVAVAARNPNKAALRKLSVDYGVTCYACDATEPQSVAGLFASVRAELGEPRLVVHNIDGRSGDIFRKRITEAKPDAVQATIQGGAYSAFLVAQQAALGMLSAGEHDNGGSIIFTNASAAYKGFPRSGAFAMACHAKAGLAQSMARELGPQGIHVVHVPIDAAIGNLQEDGTRRHWRAGEDKDDTMADPDAIAEMYLALHQQPRSTWSFEVVLRPWKETW